MPEISFVYDRTPEDVETARYLLEKISTEGYSSLTDIEKEIFASDLKGCRNASDLNRISNAVNIISEIMHDGGMIDFEFNLKDDWTETDIPSKLDIETILGDISALRGFVEGYSHNIPMVPNNPINTIEKMNDIERILYEVYNITNVILTDRALCGEGYLCNDSRLI